MEQWIQPLSNAGIFLVALGSVLVGKPFVREFAEVGQPKEVIETDVFKQITTVLTWIWVAAFARDDGVVGDPAHRVRRSDDPGHEDAAVLRLLLGRPVLAAGSRGAGVARAARADGPAGGGDRAQHHVRRVRRGGDRPA